MALRRLLEAAAEEVPALRSPPAIFVLNGAPRGCESELLQFGLMPVLNGLDDIFAWGTMAALVEATLPATVHVDTGMSRLGLSPAEVAILAGEPETSTVPASSWC
ncbi:MAG: alanine racemase [Rhodospirillales bacterium]